MFPKLTVTKPPGVVLLGLAATNGPPGVGVSVGVGVGVGGNGLSRCRPNHTKRGNTLLHRDEVVLVHGPCWVNAVPIQLFPTLPGPVAGRTVRKSPQRLRNGPFVPTEMSGD